MRNRLIVASFVYDSDAEICAQDHLKLLNQNLRCATTLFHLFTYNLDDPYHTDEFRFSRNDLLQLRESGVSSVTCKNIIESIPYDNKTKQEVFNLYNRFILDFMSDPRVYYMMVAIVLFNPAGVELIDRASVERVRNQYITMLERFLNCKDNHNYRDGNMKTVFDCVSSLPLFVEYQFYHNN